MISVLSRRVHLRGVVLDTKDAIIRSKTQNLEI